MLKEEEFELLVVMQLQTTFERKLTYDKAIMDN